jgi:uncharacterized protein (DUF2141 family)
MKANQSSARVMRIAFAALAVIFLAACASIGRPEGGARDVTPPEYSRSNPMPGERNVHRNNLDVWFDENIQLDDAFNKVIVSPTQKMSPVVKSQAKHLTVELRDTLLPNTTYTIDFADAIKDLNEGNVLDGFALDFSTGEDLDTLRISGIVLEARTLEPAQGITVGVYSDMVDTTLTTVPFERIARTNTYGQFTIRNLKPGNYHVFALNDLNRDNKWDRSEDIAFSDVTYTPYAESIEVNDTLRTATDLDSIVTRPGTAFYPNDVLLTWFNEDYKAQYLKNYTRPERKKVIVTMGAPSDSMSTVKIVGGEHDGEDLTKHALLQKTETNDSLVYWLRTPEVLNRDSLRLSVRHEALDSLQQICWQTDTLKFFWKEPKNKDKNKNKKKEEENDSVPHIEFTDLAVTTQAKHEVYNPLMIQTKDPIDSIDIAGIHLEVMPDSTWLPYKHQDPVVDPKDPLMSRLIDFERVPGMKYRLTVDSAAVTDIYGLYNKPLKHELAVKELEEYSNLFFTITPADTLPIVVELLDKSDRAVRTINAEGGKASFTNIDPGTYYARLFIDRNANGKWDTGCVTDSIQPEEVYYYPKKVDLKANWDVDQPWNIYEVAVDAQKPKAIKKNKPKLKKGEKEAKDDDDVEYDEWGEPIDKTNGSARSSSNRSSSNSLGNFSGGLRQIGSGNSVAR